MRGDGKDVEAGVATSHNRSCVGGPLHRNDGGAESNKSAPAGFQLNSWFEQDLSENLEAGEKAAGETGEKATATPATLEVRDKARRMLGSANMEGSIITAHGAAGADGSASCLRNVSGSFAEK